MDAFEKIIMTMRNEAKNGVESSSFGIAEMTSENTLSYNGLDLEEDDIIIPDHLKEREIEATVEVKTESVADHSHPLSPGSTGDAGGHYHDIKLEKKKVKIGQGLKEGDSVFGIMIEYDDDEKFLILCKIGGE